MKTKKILVAMVVVFAFAKAEAQFTKNDRLASLTVAPYITSQNGENDLGLILKADAEFLLTDNLSFVTSIFYSNNTTFSNNSGLPLNAYGVIPSLQYYVINTEKWRVHLMAGYGYGFTDRTIGNTQNSALTVFSAGVGAYYKVNERVYLKAQIPYFRAQNISFNFTDVKAAAPFLGIAYAF